ncbi:hypothetical protein GJAV_G00210030 [Gymnothorax javanicus]|nr:hypothetical protein GJAV_G00210030 [Gymnothorax javanicus]
MENETVGGLVAVEKEQHWEKSELGALDLVLNIGRILLFITATVAIILLTLCWMLKHKGKCCSRGISSSQTGGQDDSDLPTPTQSQQSDMEKVTEDFQLSRLRKL